MSIKARRAAKAKQNSIRALNRGKDHGSGSGTGEGLRVISTMNCWCGLDSGHDWPGKDAGEPHPREKR